MTLPKIIVFGLAYFVVLSGIKSQTTDPQACYSKIDFNYSTIDDNGLLNSEVAIDYEFCIPKDDVKVAEVMAIEPTIQIPRMAKGRIRCSEEEWLCIVSTNGPGWKDKLHAIAALPYVKRIVQTHYE